MVINHFVLARLLVCFGVRKRNLLFRFVVQNNHATDKGKRKAQIYAEVRLVFECIRKILMACKDNKNLSAWNISFQPYACNPSIEGMMKVQKKVRYINLLNSSVIDFIILLASVLILIFLSLDSINNQSVSVGQIITFIALSGRIFSSLVNIMDENLDLQENEIILKRYLDFNAKQSPTKDIQVQSSENNNKIKDFDLNTIRFENIGFEYVPQKPVLKDFSLSLEAGEKIKLEGNNGAGKSTFCKILSMLYTPTAGNIYINN